jgi:hypothetical protein
LLISLGDPADDVQILSYLILNKLATVNPLFLASHVDKLSDKFTEATAKFEKSLGAKTEGERVNDCVRSFARALLTLSRIPEIESAPKFKDFYSEKVNKNAKLKEIVTQLASNL